MRPKAKRNGVYGYRATIEFEDGRPPLTISKTVHPAKYMAETAAKQWILEHQDDPQYRDIPDSTPPPSQISCSAS